MLDPLGRAHTFSLVFILTYSRSERQKYCSKTSQKHFSVILPPVLLQASCTEPTDPPLQRSGSMVLICFGTSQAKGFTNSGDAMSSQSSKHGEVLPTQFISLSRRFSGAPEFIVQIGSVPVSNQSTDFLNSWLIARRTAAPGSFSPRSSA